MRAALRKALRFAALLLSMLPAACHWTFTGPALWAHHSSAAFNFWLLLWLVCIAAPVVALAWALDDGRQQQTHRLAAHEQAMQIQGRDEQ